VIANGDPIETPVQLRAVEIARNLQRITDQLTIPNRDPGRLHHQLLNAQQNVVAALIDRESTLKTFAIKNGRPFLRAENPDYPDLHPAHELLIQGVLVALIRKCR